MIRISPLFCLLFLLTSCYALYDTDEDMQYEDDLSSVRVLTRSVSGDTPSCPLHAFVFKGDGEFFSQQQFEASEQIRLSIPQKADSRIVIVAADSEAYDIPTSPAITSVITPKLPEGVSSLARGYAQSPLQMGFVEVHPQSANATVTIQLNYQVASLSVQLSQLPSQCSSSYISVASPAQGITFGGELQGVQSTRIPLTRVATDGGNTFVTPSPLYLLPTTGQTTFTIAYNDADGEQFASATYLAPLLAATPYQINGSYSNGSFFINGSITPSEWSDPVSLSFTFSSGEETIIPSDGQSGATVHDDPTVYTVTSIPQPLSVWEGHLVIDQLTPASSDAPATLLLMSIADWGDLTSALNASNPTAASDIVSTYDEFHLTGWRIPTEDEARLLSIAYRTSPDSFEDMLFRAQADAIALTDDKGSNLRYLCSDAEKTFSFKTNSVTQAGATVKTYHLRLVRTIKVRQK